jgi:hypothetical protein
MDYGSELPLDVLEAARLIRAMQDKSYMSRAERENLNRAKLRIAFWACRNENIVATRGNLSYVLGQDAAEIMGAYDRYLEREDDRERDRAKDDSAGKQRRGGGTQFWGNA